MRVREIGLSSAGPDDIERWKALVDRAAEPNPFFEPVVVRSAAVHLGDPEPTLLVVEDGDRWLACLPVGPARVARVLAAWRSWCHLYCFLGTPLLDDDQAGPAARALLAHAVDRAPGGRLVLERINRDGPVARALALQAQGLALVVTELDAHARALVRRRAAGGYTDNVRSHHRREVARLGRRLEAELGPVAVVDQAGSLEAVERFIELEGGGWKGRSATALGGSPAHALFFRDLCRRYLSEESLALVLEDQGDQEREEALELQAA